MSNKSQVHTIARPRTRSGVAHAIHTPRLTQNSNLTQVMQIGSSHAVASANDNDADNSNDCKRSPTPSLYAALGYLARCPYQWWEE